MADFTALKTAIQNAIKQNGNEEITGNLLQDVLLAIVTTLGDGSINDLITALGSEATTRSQADGTLQQNIDAEAQARQQAVSAEAQARNQADSALGDRIDGVISSIVAINNAIENGYVYAGIATPSSTPTTGKVFYLALTSGTYTNFGNIAVTQGINILKYNGSAWSLDAFIGIDDTPTPSSNNLVKSGGVFNDIMTNGSAFDLTAYNNGTTYADLNAALTALNALPAAYKKGGMSMKYVQTSDNKYVQYRLMSDTFNTIVANWQGIDDVAVIGSKNPITSGFVYQYNQSYSLRSGKIEKVLFRNRITGITLSSGGYKIDNSVLTYFELDSWKYIIVPISNIARIKTAAGLASYSTKIPAIIYLSGEEPIQTNFINGYEQYADPGLTDYVGMFNSGLVIPKGATHIIVNLVTSIYSNIELYDDSFDIDQQPVQNSTNPITSGAVYEINGNLDNKINTINEVLSEEKQTKTTDVTTVHSKAVVMQNGIPVETSASEAFRYGIIPVTGLKHVITFSSTASFETKIPAIIFLRTNEITQDSYITGSEKYGTGETPRPFIAKFDEDITIPSEANYAIINCFISYTDDTTVITRDVFYDLSEFDERITELEQLTPQQKVLTVKKQPGEGEYGTIAAALAIADSETTIYIYTGIYEENHLNLPKGVTIIGIGDVEIRGYLQPSTAIATSTNYSTLECYNGATLENLKITAQNMRYPIHADFSAGNAKWNVKNCIFEHKGNKEINDYWAAQTGDTSGIVSACSAWGGGTRGGDNVYCFNCKFISTGRAFSTHNNAENSYENYGASHVVLESCEMISKGIDRDGVLVDLLAPLFIQSLNCPINGCDVVVSNCSFNGYIVFLNSGGDGWSNKLKVFNCGKNKIAFSGYGSGPDLIRNGGQITTYQSHYDKYPLISDCCHSFVNRGSSAITKGKAVKLTDNGGIAQYNNTADDVFGVAMQDISVGETGDVWFDGYLSRIWFDGLRTTNITEGSDIYVDNTGSFAVSGTKIAFKAVDNQNIKLFNN